MASLAGDRAWVDTPTADGDTPLLLAAMAGAYGVAELLLKEGASWRVHNAAGLCALHAAAGWGHLEVLQLLIEHAAPADAAALAAVRVPGDDTTSFPPWLLEYATEIGSLAVPSAAEGGGGGGGGGDGSGSDGRRRGGTQCRQQAADATPHCGHGDGWVGERGDDGGVWLWCPLVVSDVSRRRRMMRERGRKGSEVE